MSSQEDVSPPRSSSSSSGLQDFWALWSPSRRLFLLGALVKFRVPEYLSRAGTPFQNLVPDVPGCGSDRLAGLLRNHPPPTHPPHPGCCCLQRPRPLSSPRLCSLVGGNETPRLGEDGGDLTASLEAAAGESAVGTDRTGGGGGGGRSQMAWHTRYLPPPPSCQ